MRWRPGTWPISITPRLTGRTATGSASSPRPRTGSATARAAATTRRCTPGPQPGTSWRRRRSTRFRRSGSQGSGARCERVVHLEVLGGTVGSDRYAVAGQQRVVVDDRIAGHGEADPVAEQREAGRWPAEFAGVLLAQGRRGDGLAGPGHRQAVLGEQGVEPALAGIAPLDGADP